MSSRALGDSERRVGTVSAVTTLVTPPVLEGRALLAANAERGCVTCAHGLEHGWWGPSADGGSHCPRCERYWTSTVEGHCVTCCAHFANVRAFDQHFARDGSHLDPATAQRRDGRPRFVARRRSKGVTWARATYGVAPEGFGARAVSA